MRSRRAMRCDVSSTLAARPGEETGPGLRRRLRGLNGRTTVVTIRSCPDYVNGRRTLPPILHSHKPIDVLVIMLGTNDLKKHLNLSPQLIAHKAATLRTTLRMDVWRSAAGPARLPVNVRQPPPSCRFAYSFDGGAAKAPPVRNTTGRSHALGVAFLDANEATQIPDPRQGGDGIHLSAQPPGLGAAVAAGP